MDKDDRQLHEINEKNVKSTVSVIAPVYNEEDVIEEFTLRLRAAANELDNYFFEFIMVNDGSKDRSLAILLEIESEDSRFKVIDLRRNYGQAQALQAGFDAAKGDIIITMDSDLQHFPEEISMFLAKLEEGYDMVCGWRHQRREGIIRRWPSRCANWLIRKISGIDIHDFGTTFRAYRSEIVDDIELYGEFHRFVPVLGALAGAKVTELPIENIERPKGKSSYGIGRTFGVFIDLFTLFFLTRYLDRPMRLFGSLAMAGFAFGGILLTIVLLVALKDGLDAFRVHLGWYLTAILLLIVSLQVLLTGLLGEIMMRVHFTRKRQTYHIRKRR